MFLLSFPNTFHFIFPSLTASIWQKREDELQFIFFFMNHNNQSQPCQLSNNHGATFIEQQQQHLRRPTTTITKFQTSLNHRIYITKPPPIYNDT